jgi:hypothetical protein
VGPTTVVLAGNVNVQGQTVNVQPVSGAQPFVAPALNSVLGWRFVNAGQTDWPISITFLFRPAAVYSAAPIQFPPPAAGSALPRESPPMPLVVVDPGYPPTAQAEGPVVLQIEVGVNGAPGLIREIGVAHPLGANAIAAVRQWKFQPATQAGRVVPGTAIAVITFLRPVIA